MESNNNNITKPEVMTGRWELPLSNPTLADNFNEFAFDIEREILRGNGFDDCGLLGDHEYDNLIIDLNKGVPQTQKYINLINGVNYENPSGTKRIFRGIAEMLRMFVWSEWVRKHKFNITEMGLADEQVRNAVKAMGVESEGIVNTEYNRASDLHNGEAYNYIYYNSSDFPKWEYTEKDKYLTRGVFT